MERGEDMEYVGINGRRFREKPEEMTQLTGNVLVSKDHPRILFRGQMDLLQGMVVVVQAQLVQRGESGELVEALEDILGMLRQIVRSEVLDVPLPTQNILGLTPAELRERSHDPMKFYGVEQMTPPHHDMGLPFALLNQLRAQVRVVEERGVAAFKPRPTEVQQEILRTLNRLSSAFHILMCRWRAGEFRGH